MTPSTPWLELAAESRQGTRHLALPSRRRPRWIVPVSTPSIVAMGMGMYAPATWRGRAFKAAMSCLLRLGLPQLLNQSVWLDPGRPGPVLSALRPIFPGAPLVGRVICAVGTPGGRQKLTMQVLDTDGVVLAYCKVGRTELARNALRHEGVILKALAGSPVATHVPRLVAMVDETDMTFLVTSPGVGEHAPTCLSPAVAQFLVQLVLPLEMVTVSEIIERLQMERRLARLESILQPEIFRALRRAQSALQSAEASFTCALQHGDFAPWNIRMSAGQPTAAFVYDWEFGQLNGLAGWDLLHFIAQVGILASHWDARQLLAGWREGLANQDFSSYVGRTAMSPPDWEELKLVYLFESLLAGFEREGAVGDAGWKVRLAAVTLLLDERQKGLVCG